MAYSPKPVVVHFSAGCRKNVHARTRDPWAVSCTRCRKNRTFRTWWNTARRIIRTR